MAKYMRLYGRITTEFKRTKVIDDFEKDLDDLYALCKQRTVSLIKPAFNEDKDIVYPCPQCDSLLNPDDDYCFRCGKRVKTKKIN